MATGVKRAGLPSPGTAALLLFLGGWLAAAVCGAAPARIAVLELGNQAELSDAEGAFLTDQVRGALAGSLSDSEFLIMTRESIQELLPPGVSLKDCLDAVCEVEIGRTIGADYVVSGEVLTFAGEYRLILKAHDCHSAAFLTSRTVGAPQLGGLEEQLPQAAGSLALHVRRTARESELGVARPPTDPGAPSRTDDNWFLDIGPRTVVRFESRPAGAAVYMDGELVCAATPCSRELPTGLANITMERPRHQARQDMVHITGGDAAFVISWDLLPDHGWLSVTTEPPGLAVAINGVNHRTARGDTLELTPGFHEVRVTDARFERTTETVQIRRGQWRNLVLTPVPREGALQIRAVDTDSNAVTASVWVDGEPFGTTPTAAKILVGRHRVEVRGDAGRWLGELEILQHETTALTATLSPTGVMGRANSAGIAMVHVEPGTFLMGSPPYEAGRDEAEDRHQVRLTRGFLMGATEVTQAQWAEVMGMSPEKVADGSVPATGVDWFGAIRFCNALSRREGLTPAYTIDGQDVAWERAAEGYRLPTEAEWEFACRAGTTTRFAGGDGNADLARIGWYRDNSNGQPQPAGQLPPNGWGLHDMHGNVWEWCWNWSSRYPARYVTDPVGPNTGRSRVIRGGAWDTTDRSCRSAAHNAAAPLLRAAMIGFRVVRNAPGDPRYVNEESGR